MIPDFIDTFCRTERPAKDTALCFVDIEAFCKVLSEGGFPEQYRRMRGLFFSPSGVLQRYFDRQEIEKINGFRVLKKQVEWMAGKIAVKHLVSEKTGLSKRDVRISAEKSGRPFLEGYPDINISISHSGDLAVAAAGYSGRDVAVDIELVETGRMKSIGRIAFSDNELEKLAGKSEQAHYQACFSSP